MYARPESVRGTYLNNRKMYVVFALPIEEELDYHIFTATRQTGVTRLTHAGPATGSGVSHCNARHDRIRINIIIFIIIVSVHGRVPSDAPPPPPSVESRCRRISRFYRLACLLGECFPQFCFPWKSIRSPVHIGLNANV